MLVNFITNERPIVLHFPGISTNPQKYKTWDYFSRVCLNSKIFLEPDNELTVVTWNSKIDKGIVENRFDKNNLPYLVVGKEKQNWVNSDKIQLTLNALNSIQTKYVMGVDCYDVLFFGSPKEILQRFKSMNCKMLFNAEKYFWPDCQTKATNVWKQYESKLSSKKTKYLNSGVWIAELDFCKEFYKKCLIGVIDLIDLNELPENLWKSKTIDSDQIIMHRVWYEFFKDSPFLSLDYENKIFMNLADCEDDLLLSLLI